MGYFNSFDTGSKARGSITLNLIVILVITGVIGVTLMSLTSTTFIQQIHSDSAQRAESLAESGFRYLASRYRQAVDNESRNAVLKELHGRTFSLSDGDGRFTLGVYPYVYMVRTAANSGSGQVGVEFFGSKPDHMTIPSNGMIAVLLGSRYTVYSYSSLTGDNVHFTFVNLVNVSDNSPGLDTALSVGTTVFPVFPSEVKVLTNGAGNSLTVPGSGSFMPSADGVFEIIGVNGERVDGNGVKTKIYTYKTRNGNTLQDISEYPDNDAAFSLALTATTKIVVHKSAEIRSKGTVSPGTDAETNRVMGRMTALGYTLETVSAGDLIYDTPDNKLKGLIDSATVNGDASLVAGGKIGSAMVFDGDMDYIRLDDHPDLDLSTEGSIGAWIKVTAFDNNFAGIIRKGGLRDDSDLAYSLEFRADKRITLKIVGTTKTLSLDSDSALSAGIWYHVAGTWGPAGMAIYVDGMLDSSAAQTLAVRNTTGTVQIGAQLDEVFNPSQKNRGFHGIMDEVFIFNTQKNLCEIRDIYSNPCNVGCDAYVYYPFSGNYEDGSGEDKAGNDIHNGTPYGTSISTDRFDCSQCSSQYGFIDYVIIPQEADFDLTESFTIAFWVKISALSSILGSDSFVTKGSNSYRVTKNSGSNSVNFGTTGLSVVNTSGSVNIGGNVWHHVAVVYDRAISGPSRKIIYINGEMDVSRSVTGNLSQNNSSLRFGSTGLLVPFIGSIDDVAIWKRALTEAEIQNVVKGIRTDPSLP